MELGQRAVWRACAGDKWLCLGTSGPLDCQPLARCCRLVYHSGFGNRVTKLGPTREAWLLPDPLLDPCSRVHGAFAHGYTEVRAQRSSGALPACSIHRGGDPCATKWVEGAALHGVPADG